MLFNSHVFLLVFLPSVWGIFWMLRGRPGRAELFLIAASLLFYGWGAPWLVLLLGSTIVINFAVGRCLTVTHGGTRRVLLTTGIAANVALLAYFKFADFLIQNVNVAMALEIAPLVVGLPLGISFFTFQQIGYLVDVGTGHEPERSLRRYALFIAYFPQLVAGPIVHHRHFIPQLERGAFKRIRSSDLAAGLTLVAIGLAKKVLGADSLAPMSDALFHNAETAGSLDAWLGTLAFTLQIYFDFSGYADMAVGLGRLFGLRLPVNFRSPYQAASIIDFWHRWHITLSDFLRSYIYIPLGGNRRGVPRHLVNILVVMLVGGLWHGASWTFVAWGAVHGVLLIANHLWRRFWRPATRRSPAGVVVCHAATFLAVAWAWVLFRAPSFEAAASISRALVNAPSAFRGSGGARSSLAMDAFAEQAVFWLPHNGLVAVAALLLVVWLAPNAERIAAWVEHGLDGRRSTFLATASVAGLAGLMLAASVLSLASPREFIYFRF